MAPATSKIDFPLYDADQHYYEAADSFTRHLDPTFSYAFRWTTTDDGRRQLIVADRLFQMIKNPTFNPVAKPGALADYFRGLGKDTDPKSLIGQMEPIRAEYQGRAARLRVLDGQGVQAVIMLPTLALGLEELLHDDPPALHAVFAAFNRWIDEEWGFNRDNRIIAPPVFSLVDPGAAEEELKWVIDHGARVIAFRPAPVSSPSGPRSLADPSHDRFWAIAAEANVVVAFHAADSGYAKYAADWGERTSFGTFSVSPFAETLSLHIERPIFDTLAALIAHGVFDRHPRLRVATVELGLGWAPDLVRRLGLAYAKMPHSFGHDPVEVLRDRVWATPFQEENLAPGIEAIGLDHVLFGSDWPHPEGLAEPGDFLADVADLTPEQQRRIMSDNLRELLAA